MIQLEKTFTIFTEIYNMSKKKQLTEDEVYKILKQFTIECVHGGDFDTSEENTLSVLKTWWNKYKNKYSTDKKPVCYNCGLPIKYHKSGEPYYRCECGAVDPDIA